MHYATDISDGILFQQQQQLHISTGSKVNPCKMEQSRNSSRLAFAIPPLKKKQSNRPKYTDDILSTEIEIEIESANLESSIGQNNRD